VSGEEDGPTRGKYQQAACLSIAVFLWPIILEIISFFLHFVYTPSTS
jgi:hypothetical protein